MNFTTAAPAIPNDIGAKMANGTTAKATFDAILARQAQLGTNAPLNKVNATAAPTANDDSGDGYGVGSVWVNVTTDVAYVCVDATLTAAVWKLVTEQSNHNLAATTNPGATADSTDGYSVGSLWVNVTLDLAYICLDATADTAIWRRIGAQAIDNLAATTNPGVTNDVDEGYSVGSLWVNVTLDLAYICLDATDGAAVWRPLFNTLLATQSVLTFDDEDSPGGDPAFVNISPEGGHLTLVSAEGLGGVFAKISPTAALRALVDADPAGNLGAKALYLDENGATDGTGKLLADLSGGNTGIAFHLTLTNGQVVPVYDVTTPGTPGVAVNWNEPAGELQFISPTNADATVKTSATIARGFSL
jgi:hypothetical protein